MANSLGTLALKTSLDTNGWDAGFTKGKQGLMGFGAGVGSFLTSKLFAATAAIGGLVTVGGAIRHTSTELAAAADRVDRLAKVSDRLEIPVGQLQRIAHAGDLAGAEFDQLTKATQKMLITIGTGGKPVADRLDQIAARITRIDDPGKRAAAAVKIFGKEGAALTNVLAELPANLERADRLMRRFDLDLTRIDASQVEEMNDAWTDTKFVLDGLYQKAIVELAPAVTVFLRDGLDMLEKFNNFLGENGEQWESLATLATITGAIMINAVAVPIGQFKLLTHEVAAVAAGLDAIGEAAQGNLARAGMRLEEMSIHMGNAVTAAGELVGTALARPGLDFLDRVKKLREDLEKDAKDKPAGGGEPGKGKVGLKLGGLSKAPERGSMETARLVQSLGGDALGAVDRNTRQMLLTLKPMQQDISRLARRAAIFQQLRPSNL